MAGIFTNFAGGTALNTSRGAANASGSAGNTSAVSNGISLNWPSDPTSGLTTVYGTMRLAASTTVPDGTLTIDNTTGLDSAHTYVTALPSTIKNSFQTAKSALLCFEPGLQGLFSRATLQATPVVLQTGYRGDFFRLDASNANLRVIKALPGTGLLVKASVNLVGVGGMSYYYSFPQPTDVTMHMDTIDSGGNVVVNFWMSAPGKSDTPVCTWTDTSPIASGRIGFLSFANPVFDNFWSSYAATWTV